MSQHTIMIVDDDPISRKLFAGILEKQGYGDLVLANTGEQALNALQKGLPDLILLDIFLPGIQGYEVCKQLKSSPETRHIPVIMVTGGPAQADDAIEKSFDAGATDFVTKPVQTIAFLARIKAGLAMKDNHDRLAQELERRRAAEKENRQLIEKLQKALAEIKSLEGIIPICTECKKIRDDQGYWNRLEAYLEAHSDALFSHSICPECSERLYGGDDWFQDAGAEDKP